MDPCFSPCHHHHPRTHVASRAFFRATPQLKSFKHGPPLASQPRFKVESRFVLLASRKLNVFIRNDHSLSLAHSLDRPCRARPTTPGPVGRPAEWVDWEAGSLSPIFPSKVPTPDRELARQKGIVVHSSAPLALDPPGSAQLAYRQPNLPMATTSPNFTPSSVFPRIPPCGRWPKRTAPMAFIIWKAR